MSNVLEALQNATRRDSLQNALIRCQKEGYLVGIPINSRTTRQALLIEANRILAENSQLDQTDLSYLVELVEKRNSETDFFIKAQLIFNIESLIPKIIDQITNLTPLADKEIGINIYKQSPLYLRDVRLLQDLQSAYFNLTNQLEILATFNHIDPSLIIPNITRRIEEYLDAKKRYLSFISISNVTINRQLLAKIIAECWPYADLTALQSIQKIDDLSYTGLALVWGQALNYPLLPIEEISTEAQLIELFVNHTKRRRLRPLAVKPQDNRVLRAREAAILRDKIKKVKSC